MNTPGPGPKSVGHTGVDLRYHNKKEWFDLSTEQQYEVKSWSLSKGTNPNVSKKTKRKQGKGKYGPANGNKSNKAWKKHTKKSVASAVEVATKEATDKALDYKTPDDKQTDQIAEVLLGYNKGGK